MMHCLGKKRALADGYSKSQRSRRGGREQRELQHALAVEPHDKAIDEEALVDETLMISVYAGIVAIDEESNVIRPVHYTTEGCFERDKFPRGQTSIAMTCLTYLSFDAFKVGYASSDKKMEIRPKEYPLLQYASQY
jgi:hypothetical protein